MCSVPQLVNLLVSVLKQRRSCRCLRLWANDIFSSLADHCARHCDGSIAMSSVRRSTYNVRGERHRRRLDLHTLCEEAQELICQGKYPSVAAMRGEAVDANLTAGLCRRFVCGVRGLLWEHG